MMHLRHLLFLLGLCAALPALPAHAAHAADPLESLVAASAERLKLADKVALSKWNSDKPVQDTPREQQVIAAATAASSQYQLPPALTSRFFADQIEASKQVQYRLLADWRRAGRAPSTPRADLARDIRPQLDNLQQTLLQALADSRTQRGQPDCRQQLAKLSAQQSQRRGSDVLHAIALDRALASACEP